MARRSPESHPFGAAVANLVDQFSNLPGVGNRTAERLAHHILACHETEALALADAIRNVKESIRPCDVCFNLTETEICRICSSPQRNKQLVCIVEQPRDVIALEASGTYDGVYHVLRGRISPLEGIGPEDLTIDALVRRVRRDGIQELIMSLWKIMPTALKSAGRFQGRLVRLHVLVTRSRYRCFTLQYHIINLVRLVG